MKRLVLKFSIIKCIRKKETRADRGNFVNCRRSGTIRVGHNVIHKVLINAGECVLCFKTRRVTWHCVF